MNKSYFERGCQCIRKPRNGRVKVLGKWYVPINKSREYNGELDGVWCCFYKYPRDNGKVIAFWGTKRMSDAIGTDYDSRSEPNVIDGYIYWTCWEEVKE